MKSNFIPRRDGDLYTLEGNFSRKIVIHGPALGLDADEIAESVAILERHMNAYSGMNSKKAESKSATELNLQESRNAKNELRRIAKKIKACKKYTPAIGDDLSIIGPDVPEQALATMKPSLSAVYNGNELVIKFRKNGTSGVNIYSRRGSETDYAFLGFDASSPYIDARVKLDTSRPEAREYYAMFIDGDKEIGQPSNTLKVIVP